MYQYLTESLLWHKHLLSSSKCWNVTYSDFCPISFSSDWIPGFLKHRRTGLYGLNVKNQQKENQNLNPFLPFPLLVDECFSDQRTKNVCHFSQLKIESYSYLKWEDYFFNDHLYSPVLDRSSTLLLKKAG